MNLNKLVQIERQATQQDSAGQQKQVWTELAQTWASIRPLSSRQYYAASGERSEVTHEIIMRHGVDIQSRDRIVYGDRVFDVLTPVNVDERDRYLNCRSVEHVE